MADDVDRDRRDAVARERARDGHGAPFLLSVNPWPKIATGQPPAGAVPAGTNSVNCTLFTDCTAGHTGSRPHRRDHLGGRLVVRRVVGSERERADAGEERQEEAPGENVGVVLIWRR